MGAKGVPPVLVLAGTSSGVGKTSIATGLMRALRSKGLTVQAFKCGPDFLDPMHHEQATGRPSINLDSWMLSRAQVLAAFRRHTADADVAVVEGVMGLFDGRDGVTEQGSTAQLAKWLGAPVLLVLDASAVARSAAAVAKGYIEFDPALRLGGILFNKVGGPAHTTWLRDALAAAGIRAAVLGGIPKSDAVAIPERHLGLHMPGDESVPAGLVDALADLVSTHVDLDAVLALAAEASPPADADAEAAPPAPPAPPQGPPVRIAVARDAAFCFYYHDNLALLRAAGAELVPFSPLVEGLPADVAGVYLGGGYPERYAADLADNRALRASLAAFARAGGVVYAECGGLLYLSKSIQPHPDGPAYAMAGVFPFRAVMRGDKMSMGYVEVAVQEGCPLFPPGARVRGQVHHYSEIVQESVVRGLGQAMGGAPAPADQAWHTCYTVVPQIPGAAAVEEGFTQQSVLASYVHLHFGNCPEFASSLVEKCRTVGLAAVAAAVSEAVQTAAYLESAVGSLHASPQASKGSRGGVPHSRSSPDFSREDRLAAKQRMMAAADAEVHRGHSEDVLPSARHHHMLHGDGGAHHLHLSRHSSLQQPGMPPRSLSPATTLSKVVSATSLNSYSPHHAVGVLPPGETLSPPLSDSPQQLSPRELEQQQHAPPHHYFGGPGPPPTQPQQYQQHYQQQQYQQQNGHAPQHAYGNGALWGVPDHQTPPHAPAYGAPPRQVTGSQSWPRLHQPACGHGGPPLPGRGGAHHQQPPYSLAASPPYVAANGGTGVPPLSGGSRHSRSDSYERPASASAAAMLIGRTPSPLDLSSLDRAGLERLEPPRGHMSATPFNWQHSHPSDKVVSLSPGATEMLWALGLGARVAAVSDVCDFPPDAVARAKARHSFAAIRSTPSVTSLDRHGSDSTSATASPTAAQQRSSAAAWQAAAGGDGGLESLDCRVDEEVLARERPGLVVYEEEAAAPCANGAMIASAGGMGRAVLEALVAASLQHSCRVVCVRRRTLSDVLESMLAVGEAAGVRDEALRTVDRMRARLRRAAGDAAAAAAAAPTRPRVLVLQSLRPLRMVGWWVPDQVTLAGGTCDLEAAGDMAAELTWEQVQAFAPDVLVVAGMRGASALRPLTDLCTVASLPGWWLLPAVRASAVFVVDAALFCRAGPRLVEGVECLTRLLWGEAAEAGSPPGACPDRAVLKLSLRPGQRCRPRLLPNHFMPL